MSALIFTFGDFLAIVAILVIFEELRSQNFPEIKHSIYDSKLFLMQLIKIQARLSLQV
jgi:hypothetical protein